MATDTVTLSKPLLTTARPEAGRKAEANPAASFQSNQLANQNKLTEDQKTALEQQAKATEIVNRKTLLQSMFAQGSQGDTKALRIFYQEAANSIESFLQQEFGDESFSLQNLIDTTSGVPGQEDYWSSENTAERIMLGATSYFETFRKQNPQLSEEELVERYVNLISPALEKGMNEAIEILQGFGAFEGHIKTTVEETQRLVREKLAAFSEKMLGASTNPAVEEQPVIDSTNVEENN